MNPIQQLIFNKIKTIKDYAPYIFIEIKTYEKWSSVTRENVAYNAYLNRNLTTLQPGEIMYCVKINNPKRNDSSKFFVFITPSGLRRIIKDDTGRSEGSLYLCEPNIMYNVLRNLSDDCKRESQPGLPILSKEEICTLAGMSFSTFSESIYPATSRVHALPPGLHHRATWHTNGY